jgi:tripartite-type tricarboxylate transporter receptor subunit TctC
VARLYAEVKNALASPDMEQFVTGMGSEPAALDPQAAARLVNEETARWAEVAKAANIERQ